MTLHEFTKELQAHRIEGSEASNEEYKAHNGSFSTYFRNKQIKLDTQAKETHVQASQVFKNCVIYITGHTIPSAMELKRLIVENSGQVCAFMGGKSYATHVVAASLTSRKMELLANVKVVKPAWVTESVKMGRLLDWSKYRTIPVVGNSVFQSAPPLDSAGALVDEFPETDYSDTLAVENNEKDGDEGALEKLVDLNGAEGERARIEWIMRCRQRVDCMQPNFIADYFANSRLHFLTVSKLELRKRCRQFMVDRPAPLPPPPAQRTLMHVDFDSFFVAVALSKRPELKDKPVCVSHGSDGSDVASCNYVARQMGVSNGMWVARAKQSCPNLICLPYNFAEYATCSKHLYDTLFSLNPLQISAISVDEAMLDISNLVSDSPVEQICARVREEVKRLTGIDVSVGVGSNILLAKLALRRAKPAGTCVMKGVEDISTFDVRDLPGVGRHTQLQLNQDLKVGTVEELRQVNLSDLQATLGNALGQKLYNYSRGMDTSDVSSLQIPVKSVGIDVGWGVRVVTETEKLDFADKCTEELWKRLVDSGCLMELLTVKVYIKAEGAPFISPKHLGHGLSDIKSRSRLVQPKTTLDELMKMVRSLVQSFEFHPLDLRGLGLHLKVKEPLGKEFYADQQLITDLKAAGAKTPPSKRPMIAIPPRKRKRGMTLTQLVGSDGDRKVDLYEEIDMNVLAELPSQIRKEILLNEDDYVTPETPALFTGPPLFKSSKFMGAYSPEEVRAVVKDWVKNTETPTAEDAEAFCEYITGAIREDSAWTSVLDLCEWLRHTVRAYATHYDWVQLCELVDLQVQCVAKERL